MASSSTDPRRQDSPGEDTHDETRPAVDSGSSGTGDGASAEQPVDADRKIDDSLGTRVADFAENVAEATLTESSLREARANDDNEEVEAPERVAATKRGNKPVMASPLLSLPRAKSPRAITLFIHGGDESGNLRMRRGDPAYLRMVPFARHLERHTHSQVGGALVRLSVRGWNEPDLPAVQDTQWAIQRLRARYPDVPLAIAGHSMGGRVVLELLAQEEFAAAVALAPWASEEYHAQNMTKTPLLVMHGRHDTVTDPDASRDLVERVNAAGGDARFESIAGWHAMLWRPHQWHKTTTKFLAHHLV